MTLGRVLEAAAARVAVVGTMVALLIAALRAAGGLQGIELALYDRNLVSAAHGWEADSRIVLIEVTEEDIRALGHWPLTDAEVADALERIVRHRPRAIGLDIYRDLEVGGDRDDEGRQRLEAVFRGNRHIVGVMKFSGGERPGIPPPRFLEETEQVGFSDIVVDGDGMVRRGLLYLDDGQTVYESFALRLARLYLARQGIAPQPDASNPERFGLGAVTIRPLEPDDGGYVGADTGGYQLLLDFRTGRSSFHSFPLRVLMRDEVPVEAIAEKVVVLGVTAESVPDPFYTPSAKAGVEAGPVRGLVIHAHLVAQVLRAALDGVTPLRSVSEPTEIALLALLSFAGGGVGLWARSPWRFFVAVPLGVLLIAAAGHLALLARWWIPVGAPALGWSIAAAAVAVVTVGVEWRQRAILTRLFRTHVSPAVADQLWQNRQQFMDGGRPRPQRLIATVLFADLRGFTSLSERGEPQLFFDWLNTYMDTMAKKSCATAR